MILILRCWLVLVTMAGAALRAGGTLMAPPTQARDQSDCNKDREPLPADQQFDINELLPLSVTVDTPSSCDGLKLSQLVACSEDWNLAPEACCGRECRDVFRAISSQCLTELSDLLCNMADTVDFVMSLNVLAGRCDDDFLDFSCNHALAPQTDIHGDMFFYGEPVSDDLEDFLEESIMEHVPGINGTTQQQSSECREKDKVVSMDPIDVDAFLFAVTLPTLASCKGFDPKNLTVCQFDFNVVEGCCEDACVELLAKVDNQCLDDIGLFFCSNNPAIATSVQDPLINLAGRCKKSFKPSKCHGHSSQAMPDSDSSTIPQEPDDEQNMLPAPIPAPCEEDIVEEEMYVNPPLPSSMIAQGPASEGAPEEELTGKSTRMPNNDSLGEQADEEGPESEDLFSTNSGAMSFSIPWILLVILGAIVRSEYWFL